MTFTQFNLDAPLLQALQEKGYAKPSPVQQKVIPVILQGRDVFAAAQTGTGKTAAFALPMVQKLLAMPRVQKKKPYGLILVPTRELAQQVFENILAYSQYTPLKTMVIYGGVKIGPQALRLRRGVDIVVATPGRLIDLLEQGAIKLTAIEMIVLDEADRMLDMGFIPDIKKIMSRLPEARQNLLFSATLTKPVKLLAKSFVHNPVHISIAAKQRTARDIKQAVVFCDKKRKRELLIHLLNERCWAQLLVFTKTKRSADILCRYLCRAKIDAMVIHGDKSQASRARALKRFHSGKLHVLVATDIAARGIDIKGLPQVVNYELPAATEDYVHRIGRTGRAGEQGYALSLVDVRDQKNFKAIEKFIKQTIQRETVPGFEYKQSERKINR